MWGWITGSSTPAIAEKQPATWGYQGDQGDAGASKKPDSAEEAEEAGAGHFKLLHLEIADGTGDVKINLFFRVCESDTMPKFRKEVEKEWTGDHADFRLYNNDDDLEEMSGSALEILENLKTLAFRCETKHEQAARTNREKEKTKERLLAAPPGLEPAPPQPGSWQTNPDTVYPEYVVTTAMPLMPPVTVADWPYEEGGGPERFVFAVPARVFESKDKEHTIKPFEVDIDSSSGPQSVRFQIQINAFEVKKGKNGANFLATNGWGTIDLKCLTFPYPECDIGFTFHIGRGQTDKERPRREVVHNFFAQQKSTARLPEESYGKDLELLDPDGKGHSISMPLRENMWHFLSTKEKVGKVESVYICVRIGPAR